MRLKPLCLAVCAALNLTWGCRRHWPTRPQPPLSQPASSVAANWRNRRKWSVREYRLPNGLRILLAPDASKPTTTVNITYLVGSRHENYGETGMAHLLEHLLFKGTPNNRNITQGVIQARYAAERHHLGRSHQLLQETFAANDSNLEWALQMEADRMVNSFIARKDLDTEMTVVRNEMERAARTARHASCGKRCWPAPTSGTTTAKARLARVPTSRM